MRPSTPSSRPTPESFQPPKGACSSLVSLTFTPTEPLSSFSAKSPRSLKVLTINVGGEAEWQGVRECERFALVANLSNSGDRTVRFFGHNECAIVRAIDHRGVEEKASVESFAGWLRAANDQPSAMGESILDMTSSSGPHIFVEDRSVGDSTLDAVTKFHLTRLLGERLDEGVVNGFHDNDAVHRDADLAHVGEGATRRRCRRFLNVGVIQHHKRTLSAEFERQALQRVGSRAHD